MIASSLSRGLFLSASLAMATLAGCSSSTSGEVDRLEQTGTARSAVIKGKPSDSSQDAVVLLVHYDPNARMSGVGQCTGTLLAPRLVLTARHCVGDTDRYAACASDGSPIAAGAIRSNHKPETMYVFTGKDRPKFYGGKVEPAGVGLKIVDDGGKNLCNHDIALIVLKEPILNVPIASIRMEGDVTKGSMVTSVGWGVTESTPSPDVRMQRKNVKITGVGPDKSAGTVAPNEFQVGESICSGDSGGPAFDQETNAVVGVVSRGGNQTGGDENDPAASCINGSNLYTKVTPFKDLILKGFDMAQAEPWIEGGPDPRKLKTSSTCASGDECRSALCLADPAAANELTCAEDCSQTGVCTDETQVCTTEGESQVCRAPAPPPPVTETTTSTTCSASPSTTTNGASFGIAIAIAALCTRLRRRSSR